LVFNKKLLLQKQGDVPVDLSAENTFSVDFGSQLKPQENPQVISKILVVFCFR
jgi:hypothetical protein